MNVKSKYDQEEDSVKKPQKKYMFLGYGNYGNPVMPPGNVADGGLGLVRSPHFFDAILEMLGIKKKNRKRSEGEE